MFSWILWDWNGTLLDDAATGFSAMNRLLARRGLPPLESLGRYREIFTFPVREYYRAAGLDLEKEIFEDLAVEWTALYYEYYPHSGLFPGARETLARLEGMGLRQAIVSASHQEALERQVEEHGLSRRFQALLGVSDIYAGGKAGLARAFLRERGVDPRQALFIGDTLHDWEVAGEAGCPCVLLACGHQSRERLAGAGVPVLEGPAQVLAFLKGQAALPKEI